MKKSDQIVAELNQSVPRVRRFCYDIEAEDVVTFPRLTRSDKPDFHIQLEDNQEATLPLTSTPTHSSDFPFQVPLPPLKPHDSLIVNNLWKIQYNNRGRSRNSWTFGN